MKMLNNVILVGRLVETPALKVLEKGQSFCAITLAVMRSFRNSEGEYDTDFIRCALWEGIAESTCEYCRKGSIIGIKGRLITRPNEITFTKGEEVFKKTIKSLEIVAERVSFISSKKENVPEK